MTSLSMDERPSRSFGRIFGCGCAAVGGFAAGHMGCIAAFGLAIATGGGMSAAGIMGLAPALGLSFGFAAIGLATWYALRGKQANLTERIIVPTTTAIGLAGAVFMHTTEAGHNFFHTHIFESLTGQSAAELWIANLSEEERLSAEIIAQAQGISLLEYAESVCSSPIQNENENNLSKADLKVSPS